MNGDGGVTLWHKGTGVFGLLIVNGVLYIFKFANYQNLMTITTINLQIEKPRRSIEKGFLCN